MKKLLGIAVLGLLLSGNAYSNSVFDYLEYGMTKKQVHKIVNSTRYQKLEEFRDWVGVRTVALCFKGDKNINKYFSNFNTEITTHYNPKGNPNVWYVFENVTKPSETKFSGCKRGDGTLKAVAFSRQEAIDLANASFVVNYSNFKKITKREYNEKEEKIIAEKPKKKKPKQLPEDNKVVPAGSGSGFFVSRDGHVITNHHVIEGCNTTKVSFKGNQVDAQILAVDKMNDIAILKTNIKPNSIFPISNEDVSLLEDVVVAGYPLGKQVSSAIKTHKGVVTALAGAGDNYSNFQTDASINAGNSGGPIMNQKGNIVGIAVATWVQDGVQGVHFGIKSSTLKTFANSNSLKFSQANNRELSNKDLGKLITEATVYLECHMTVAKIKRMIAEANNQKAFFSEFK